jgi:Enoyl-(Acyl carrier protein) reductase
VALPGDIKDEAFCRQLVEDAGKSLDGLDILVNNAGKQATRPDIGDISSEQFDHTMKTNIYAMFWITRAAERHLPPGASIINTASVQAYKPIRDPARLRHQQGGHCRLRQGAVAADDPERRAGQCCGPRPVLDRPAAQRRPDPGEGRTLRRAVRLRPARPTGGAGPIYVLLASQEASYITGEVYAATGGSEAVAWRGLADRPHVLVRRSTHAP